MTHTGPGGEHRSAGSRDPDALRRRAGVRGDPALDQHFLVDDRVLDRIPEYGAGFEMTHVLEIGAGTGALTDRLLASADRVTAIEQDPDLACFLRREFEAAILEDRLRVIEGDALAVSVPEFTASVSNLPYGISSEVLFRLLPRRKPVLATVQREFADRMVAAPGSAEYGRLSVTAGHYAAVQVVEPVPKAAFAPRPAVESAIVRATPRDPEYDVEEAFFLRFVKALFTQRRKTTRNAIRNTTHISGIENESAVLEAADEELLEARPGTLTPAEFAALANTARTSAEGDS